ncbi:MAG TPA: heme o synthase [Planctomycetota bacterium]|jgi:protoheme IX farnesyltransferase
MDVTPRPADTTYAGTIAGILPILRDCMALSKARLTTMVLISTLAGYCLGARDQLDWMRLLETLFGTALVAAGASALNQVWERVADGIMRRTRQRPLPQERMRSRRVMWAAIAISVTGLLYLDLRVNGEACLWAAVTLLLYVLLYTPMKQRSPFNTLVGAVAGALPPVIGWAAVAPVPPASVPAESYTVLQPWSLFLLLFVWQLPHFLATAWLYQDDYQRVGMRMWPNVDNGGAATGRLMVVESLLLIPVSILPCLLKLSGMAYGAGAIVCGLALAALSIQFAIKRTDRTARGVFIASIAYLPIVLTLMVADRL